MLRAESGEIHRLDAQTPPHIRSKTHQVTRNFSFTTEMHRSLSRDPTTPRLLHNCSSLWKIKSNENCDRGIDL